eukprot:10767170-Alexandrium_andersonii.AAC.1
MHTPLEHVAAGRFSLPPTGPSKRCWRAAPRSLSGGLPPPRAPPTGASGASSLSSASAYWLSLIHI